MSNQGILTKSVSGIPCICIDNTSPEWEKAWAALYEKYENHISVGCEVWQYMGTWLTEGTTWVHQFRHRDYHGERKYVDITPTDEFLASIPDILAAS
jgi:hypothetical protein